MTSAPSSASKRAIAAPRPREPPVTIATLPERSFDIFTFLCSQCLQDSDRSIERGLLRPARRRGHDGREGNIGEPELTGGVYRALSTIELRPESDRWTYEKN